MSIKSWEKKNIVFIGAERCGFMVLEKLLEMGMNISGVVTLDTCFYDRVTDYISFDPLIERYSVSCLKLKNLERSTYIPFIDRLKPDLILVISWSFIIPKEVLTIPKLGCIGIHNSLLPQRRGGAPVAWAIIDGLRESGITLFYYTETIDAGDIIAQKRFEITHEDNARTVLDKVNILSVDIIQENIYDILKGINPKTPQGQDIGVYTRQRRPEDGLIDWSLDPEHLYNWIRAQVPPYPGAYVFLGKYKLVFTDISREGKRLKASIYIESN